MSICMNCVSNVGGKCTWEEPVYPNTFRCNHHIGKALVLVPDVKKPEPTPTLFEAHSKTEPDKCIFFAKLP